MKLNNVFFYLAIGILLALGAVALKCKAMEERPGIVRSNSWKEFNIECLNQFQCDQCGKKFDNQNGLNRHKGRAHARAETCLLCKAICKNSAQLKAHMKTHKLIKCAECGESFKNALGLKVHSGHMHKKAAANEPAPQENNADMQIERTYQAINYIILSSDSEQEVQPQQPSDDELTETDPVRLILKSRVKRTHGKDFEEKIDASRFSGNPFPPKLRMKWANREQYEAMIKEEGGN